MCPIPQREIAGGPSGSPSGAGPSGPSRPPRAGSSARSRTPSPCSPFRRWPRRRFPAAGRGLVRSTTDQGGKNCTFFQTQIPIIEFCENSINLIKFSQLSAYDLEIFWHLGNDSWKSDWISSKSAWTLKTANLAKSIEHVSVSLKCWRCVDEILQRFCVRSELPQSDSFFSGAVCFVRRRLARSAFHGFSSGFERSKSV